MSKRQKGKRIEVDLETDQILTQFRVNVSGMIREEMGLRGISGRELSKRLGCAESYVSKVLAGKNITLDTLARIAIALDCAHLSIDMH